MRDVAAFLKVAAFPKVPPYALRLSATERRWFRFILRVANWLRHHLRVSAVLAREVRLEQLSFEFAEPQY